MPYSDNPNAPVRPEFKTAADGTVSAIGGGISSYWAIGAVAGIELLQGLQQGDAIRENAKLKKQIDDFNAQFSELDAYHAIQEGQAKQANYQTKIDETVGAQREALAKNNVNVGYGTAADLQADTKVTGMMNLLQIQKAARDKAQGYQNQATNVRLQGSFAQSEGELRAGAKETSGILTAANTGLSGYTRAGGYGQGGVDPEREIG